MRFLCTVMNRCAPVLMQENHLYSISDEIWILQKESPDDNAGFGGAVHDAKSWYPQPMYPIDLGATLRSKGLAFDEECKVFEVCNPGQAAKVLSIDMRLNMALSCRISVFTEKGKTKLGLI